MKKFAFLLVSAFLASASYCANATEKVVTRVSGENQTIEKLSNQQLILQPSADLMNNGSFLGHSSHSSHGSHGSHGSHSSHLSGK